MEPVAYRVSDFCRIYVISKASFYREVQAGRLQLVKRGRSTLVERVEAERWFADLKNPHGRKTDISQAAVGREAGAQ